MEQALENWQAIGTLDDFTEGEPAAVVAGNRQIAIFRLGDEVFALNDLCSHGHARLSDGYVEDGCVECPLHQGLIDIRSGAPRCAPVTEPVRAFPIRIVDSRVEVHVD
ncbi:MULTISPECIES: anthranilate 1,2-dioxygenase ferredoxin subunit AndAb [Paraburkholderia]|uniref:Anthranilate 1,2-dioxygenase ferredoxin subunit n=1 Tax=Paraburkholderia silvatlantica TaxID=321895 RepID=A0A2U1ABQ6_9BURK|nr:MULTISPECIES: anthranilate 1,2-dioxygenase ferredoxin subunit AndAb [Paraburkholderia]MBB2930310.1 anthranilate 1,2-dioxygenase ferredoxin subunit [Paraburkholderia silvatlantica]PVY32140.1 anthranilate 1,2-dioxygenase ferredoxin subunit [Paraburkholderia silvatlantica]PXW37760.1 anthranilate 1,2-dioxygenase ferredoxin subunit [Paraburkholderia silvatlantica]PYE25581.1 anthranilate 1,2-dioxygenase ferredoxin subunit [Paraburkholderia silvatlantica]TDQ97776.1 anthranilate 1,2-dioxygenase fer